MRERSIFAVAVCLILDVAGVSFAEGMAGDSGGRGAATQSQNGNAGSDAVRASGAQSGGQHAADCMQGAAGGAFQSRGEHVMTGTITNIDKARGSVSLRTSAAPLGLHFPPSSLEGLNKGDQVAVRLGITSDVSAATAEAADSGRAGTGD